MTFTRLTVLDVPEEVQAISGFASRIFADMEDAPPRAALPMTAAIGGRPVEGLGILQSPEPTLSGFLRDKPQVGDELVITIADVEIPTGLLVEDSGIA